MAVFLTMAREIYCKDVKFSAYSHTHRESHDGIAMMDVDKVSCCIACNEPLFLAELTRHKGPREDYKKGHRLMQRMAEKASMKAYIVWFHEENEQYLNTLSKKTKTEKLQSMNGNKVQLQCTK